jgi:hypothetical protein
MTVTATEKTCTVCHRAGTPECTAVFTCSCCGEVKRVCFRQAGGFGDPRRLCDMCDHRLRTGEEPVSRYTKHSLLRKQWAEEMT